jgi:uncharacterized protein (TIGR00251 family)
MDFIKETKDGILLKIHAHPGSKKNEICGLHGDSLKIKIKAPPVDGEANKSCGEFLSDILNIPQANIIIKSGVTSRNKTFLIKGITREEAQKIFLPDISE